MKKQVIFIISLMMVLSAVTLIFAVSDDQIKKSDPIEANVWTTADGAKHFTCPVMKNEGVVDKDTKFSIVDGKKYYFCCAGCQPKFEADPKKYTDTFAIPGNVVEVDAKKGEVFKCPVSGEEVALTDKTVFSEVNGKRYYFCCDNCKTKFDKNPENSH